MKVLPLLTTALLIVSCAGTKGTSKNSFEGKVTYTMTYDEVPEMMEPYMDMLPSQSVTYIGSDFTRVEQDMGMGMSQVIITTTDGESVMLLDMMGQKIMVKMPDEVVESSEEPTVSVTEETEEIAGYPCKKAVITPAEGDEIEIWYTDEIPNTNSQFAELSGMPMRYTINQNDMVITMTVTEVEPMKIGKVYSEIPEGYTEMSMDELQNMGGGF